VIALEKVQNLLDYSGEDAKSTHLLPIGHTYPLVKDF
jgi:hypothetical protein